MAKQISEITRRDLWEALAGVPWWGRLEEIDFLRRLYPLDELESEDPRFRRAASDIIQHRVANADWSDDWVFTDERFGLTDGEDEALLRFLSEMLHPAVRKGKEAEAIIAAVNPLLRSDGYQIVPKGAISGRPVFGWTRLDEEAAVVEKHFTEDIEPVVATLSELAEQDGSNLEREVLRASRPRLEEPEYDNWDGGTYYYTLTLLVPVPLFARLGDKVSDLEQKISKRIEKVLRAPDKHRVTAVVIQPGIVKTSAGTKELSRVIVQRSEQPAPQFWTPDHFRLFLSHVTSFKQRTAALRQSLSRFKISAFVAHDTIDAGELWQKEIEAALRTMDAMAAILTPGFSESKWTDQEVGWALGAGVYVLPVRRGLDPYGFIGEVQGIQGVNKKVGAVAEELFLALLRNGKTRFRMTEALIAGVARSGGSDVLWNVGLLERAAPVPPSFWQHLEELATKNRFIVSSEGVADRLRRLARSA
jgi:hypothetical protein